MSLEITRAKVEHLLKVGVWQEMTKGNLGIEWMYVYMCGSNVIVCSRDEDDFIAAIRKSDIGGLFPKIVYKPPRRSRSKYFEPGGQCGDTCGDTCDQYELLASATCIMPGGSYMPVETYDFSPFELAYVTAEQCRGQMSVFLMIVKRLNLPIPQGVRQMVYLHLVKTSNRGFHLG